MNYYVMKKLLKFLALMRLLVTCIALGTVLVVGTVLIMKPYLFYDLQPDQYIGLASVWAGYIVVSFI